MKKDTLSATAGASDSTGRETRLIRVFETYSEGANEISPYAFQNDATIQESVRGRARPGAKLVVPVELAAYSSRRFHFRGMGYPLDEENIDVLGCYDSEGFSTLESLVTGVRTYLHTLNQNKTIQGYNLQYTPAFYTFKQPPRFSVAEKALGIVWASIDAAARRRCRAMITGSFRGLTPEEQEHFERIYAVASLH